MKKVLAALLVTMMVLSLTACGKKEVIKKDFSNAQKKQQVQAKDEIPEESYVTPKLRRRKCQKNRKRQKRQKPRREVLRIT